MKYYYIPSLKKILSHADHKKIVVFGTDSFAKIVYENLKEMDIDCSYFVENNPTVETFCDREVRDIYDLMYEDHNEIFLIVFRTSGHGEIYKTLIGMGYIYERDFCLFSMAGYIDKYTVVDSLLGYSREYEGLLGFQKLGDEKNANLIVMTLGGSTSDPTVGCMKSWPEFLYEKLNEKENVVLFSGGMGGYNSNQELLKFLRDGRVIKPDILITLDGYNDVGFQTALTKHPFMHKYYAKCFGYWEGHDPIVPETLDMRKAESIVHGLDYEEEDSYNWSNNIRCIHAVAHELGCRHYAFLQPMIESGKAVIDESIIALKKRWFEEDHNNMIVQNRVKDFSTKCNEIMKGKEYFYDLTDLFDGMEDVYMDHCHYTEKGNEKIAERIISVLFHS